jgi:L-threonylcarbamoyladenylate synthase
MTSHNTVLLSDTPRGLRAALGLLRAGEQVAFPTETVYGLGADARNDRAVAGIFAAKGRPSFNPLIVHVASLASAETLATFPDAARVLAETFWPGPLTLVLPLRPGVALSDRVSAGLGTVGLRVPAHPLARRLIEGFGGPLAAPSANQSGGVSPTTAAHVLDGLRGRIAGVIDGGSCEVGVESTILGFAGEHPALLRAGGIPLAPLSEAIGEPIAAFTGDAILAPGQLSSHYAPDARLRLDAASAAEDEVWIGFGPDCKPDLNLSPVGDLREAARSLYACLREADDLARETQRPRIAVVPIPEIGLGVAINDRLRRAAAPRNRG